MPERKPARAPLRVRAYGSSGPPVILLHGGPGAPGYLAPVARELAATFRVFEPLQRGGGGKTLTVGRHVADLRAMVETLDIPEKPRLVGHSWGAMLALAFAAEHPGMAESLVLVSCGTFDEVARARLATLREERVGDDLRRRWARLEQEVPDEDERLARIGRMLLPAYSYDPAGALQDLERCDAKAHAETWSDMLRLQAEGRYPSAFAAIDVPVLMLHGVEDPHPGRLIRASLQPHLPQLEYNELERCGHYPWLERAASEEFFAKLEEWLRRRSRGAGFV